MKQKDEIAKSTKLLFEGAKDLVTRTLIDASRNHLKLDTKQLEFLITLVDRSMDDGFHRGFDVFMKSVNITLAKNVEVDTQTKPATKKK